MNFRTLNIEALGSVYESLLEMEPCITEDGKFQLITTDQERKGTGSYYTPGELVEILIQSALVPVIEDRLANLTDKDEKEHALLNIKVVDPACGSGAFLLKAMNKLTEKLVEIRLAGEEPSDLDIREARRDVVRHCIHGVDINPLAVDLCRFVLWINVAHPHFPLSYLEPLIKCGNSFIGVPLPSQWRNDASDTWPNAIPDGAFDPVSGDDTKVAKLARSARKRNATERAGQETMDADFAGVPERLVDYYDKFRASGDKTIDEIERAQHLYKEYLRSDEYISQKLAADLWCSAFLWEYEPNQHLVPTHQWFRRARLAVGTLPEELVQKVQEHARRSRFFHWHLEFPDVFESGGFDCVLGNPPWERIELSEKEFFSRRDPEIASAPNKAARERMIEELRSKNPGLYEEYQKARQMAGSESKFVRSSGRFPLAGRGDVNTYAVFAELFRFLVDRRGRAGIVCPTGIAIDDTAREFFADLIRSGSLVSLYDFENRKKIFTDIDSRYRFSLLTISRVPQNKQEFAFFLTEFDQLDENMRKIELSADDIALINPNTHTLPIFRTRTDAELVRHIYTRVPVFINESTNQNPWRVRFMRMFGMANDSSRFRTRSDLENQGYTLVGNQFVRGDDVYLPLYEGKMIWHFDHRFATYEGLTKRSNLLYLSDDQYADPCYVTMPWYWVRKQEVNAKMANYRWHRRWFLGFRDITNATNERTAIFAVFPRTAVGHTATVLLSDASAMELAVILAVFCSIPFDYVVRCKIGGTHLSSFYVKQFPVLPPQAFTDEDMAFILPRVLELVYTAWDIKPFADDIWRESDDHLKSLIHDQWKNSAQAVGAHEFTPPPWAHIDSHGIQLPPFKWDSSRRAVIRAELDAYIARLYGLNRKQLRYILDPQDILDPAEDPTCSGEHLLPAEPAYDFPGETFRVLKEKEEEQFGEYRTRELVLDAWNRLESELGPPRIVNYRELLRAEDAEESHTRPGTAPPKSREPVEPLQSELILRPPDSGQREL
ncbi:MAG: Eco57I restriction-modification methylase domain-containing protein [Armatimonadota bacterium]